MNSENSKQTADAPSSPKGPDLKEMKRVLEGLLAAAIPFEEIADEGNDDQPDAEQCIVKAGRSTVYFLRLRDFRRLKDAILKAEKYLAIAAISRAEGKS